MVCCIIFFLTVVYKIRFHYQKLPSFLVMCDVFSSVWVLRRHQIFLLDRYFLLYSRIFFPLLLNLFDSAYDTQCILIPLFSPMTLLSLGAQRNNHDTSKRGFHLHRAARVPPLHVSV